MHKNIENMVKKNAARFPFYRLACTTRLLLTANLVFTLIVWHSGALGSFHLSTSSSHAFEGLA